MSGIKNCFKRKLYLKIILSRYLFNFYALKTLPYTLLLYNKQGTCTADFGELHSRPQSPRSFWSAPGIETSGRDRSRKSANHGLPAFVRSLRNLKQERLLSVTKMGSYCACALPGPCQRSRSLAQTKRIMGSGDENG